MDEKIAVDLFARLMQMSAPLRKDLLEYLGQGPVSAESLLQEAVVRQVSACSCGSKGEQRQPE